MAAPKKKSHFRLSVFGAAVRKSGLLQKRSTGVVKRWQERAFELSGHYLRYYDPKDYDPNAAAAPPPPAADEEGRGRSVSSSTSASAEMKGVVDLKRLKTCMQEGVTLTLSFTNALGDTMKGADITLRAKTREDASDWATGLRAGISVEPGRTSRKESDAAQLAAFRGRSLSAASPRGRSRSGSGATKGGDGGGGGGGDGGGGGGGGGGSGSSSGAAAAAAAAVVVAAAASSSAAPAATKKKARFLVEGEGGGDGGGDGVRVQGGGAEGVLDAQTDSGRQGPEEEEEEEEEEETEEERALAEEDAKVALSPITAGDRVFVTSGALLEGRGGRELSARVLEVMGSASLLVLSVGGTTRLAKLEDVRPPSKAERAAVAQPVQRKKSVHVNLQKHASTDPVGRHYRKMSTFVAPPELLAFNPGVLNVQELIANNGMQGILLKKGQELSRAWKPMYFVLVLARDEIRYWSKKPINREEARSKFEGVLFMKSARPVPLLKKPKYEHTFHLQAMQNHGSSKFNSERLFEFRANSATGMAKWVAAIDFAIEKANMDMDMDDEEDADAKRELRELMVRQESLSEKLATRLTHDVVAKDRHGKKFQNASGAMLEALQGQKKLATQMRINRVLSQPEPLLHPRSIAMQTRKLTKQQLADDGTD